MHSVGLHFQICVAPKWGAIYEAVDRERAAAGKEPIGPKLRSVAHIAIIGGTFDHRLASGGLRYDVVTYRADGSGPRSHVPSQTDLDLAVELEIDADWSSDTLDAKDVPDGVAFDAHAGLSLVPSRYSDADRTLLVPLQTWELLNFLRRVASGEIPQPPSTGGDAHTRRIFYEPLAVAPGFKVEATFPAGHYKRPRWTFASELLTLDVEVTPMVPR